MTNSIQSNNDNTVNEFLQKRIQETNDKAEKSIREAMNIANTSIVNSKQMQNINIKQDNSRLFVINILAIILFLLSMLIFSIIYQQKNPPYYIMVNDNNQYLAPTPLIEPMYQENTIKGFALQMAEELVKYDFTDYLSEVNDKRPLFTESGWDSYKHALEDSQTIESIKEYKMIVHFKPLKSPVILKQGVLPNGVYAWEVEMLGNLQTTKQDVVTKLLEPRNFYAKIKLILTRAEMHKYKDGIAIQRFELTYPKNAN